MTSRAPILDTDGGVDDAQALLLLIASGRAPDAITMPRVVEEVDIARLTGIYAASANYVPKV